MIVAQDVLPSALELVWGDIASRCMDMREAGSTGTAGNASRRAARPGPRDQPPARARSGREPAARTNLHTNVRSRRD